MMLRSWCGSPAPSSMWLEIGLGWGRLLIAPWRWPLAARLWKLQTCPPDRFRVNDRNWGGIRAVMERFRPKTHDEAIDARYKADPGLIYDSEDAVFCIQCEGVYGFECEGPVWVKSCRYCVRCANDNEAEKCLRLREEFEKVGASVPYQTETCHRCGKEHG